MHDHIKFALSVPGAYSEEELIGLKKYVDLVPDGGRVVEIGCMYGRSTSIYLQQLHRGLELTVIDNFTVNGSDARPHFFKLIASFPPITLLENGAEHVHRVVGGEVDLLHVDGNHNPDGIRLDCELYLPKLKSGGVVLFHDYNTVDVDGKTLVFPQIKQTVDVFTVGWGDEGIIGCIGVRRKP